MTFADLLYRTWCAISAHRTKLVGTATAVVGFLSLNPNIVSPHVTDICEFALGLLTIFCGIANTYTIAAKVVAMQNPIEPQIGASQPKETP